MAVELFIVTPEREAFQASVQSVVLPGSEGDFGVLEGHERFLAPLRIGEVEVRESDGGTRYLALSDGFAEVDGDRVVVMVDTCECAADIDVARAERAKARAEAELEALRTRSGEGRQGGDAGEEESRFRIEERALQRALIRIQVAGKRAA